MRPHGINTNVFFKFRFKHLTSMSTYNIDDAEVLPSETFNNNNFSHINMNFAEVVKGASKYKHSETELDYNIDSPNNKEIRD